MPPESIKPQLLKGFRDFLKGRKDWDKFARKGFAPGPAAGVAATPGVKAT